FFQTSFCVNARRHWPSAEGLPALKRRRSKRNSLTMACGHFATIYLVQTLLEDSLSSANGSRGHVMMESEGNRQFVSKSLIEDRECPMSRPFTAGLILPI